MERSIVMEEYMENIPDLDDLIYDEEDGGPSER